MGSSDGVKESSAERIRVRFSLERDDDWPPADSEEIWAIPLGADVARVDSIPWFVRNLAVGDLISIRPTPEGGSVFLEKLKWSGNCTLRIIPLAEDSRGGIRDIIEQMSDYGVEFEVLGSSV